MHTKFDIARYHSSFLAYRDASNKMQEHHAVMEELIKFLPSKHPFEFGFTPYRGIVDENLFQFEFCYRADNHNHLYRLIIKKVGEQYYFKISQGPLKYKVAIITHLEDILSITELT